MKHDGHLRTRRKCRKHELQGSVFWFLNLGGDLCPIVFAPVLFVQILNKSITKFIKGGDWGLDRRGCRIDLCMLVLAFL